MALEPITAGIEFFRDIVNKIWPDKSEQEKQEIARQMAREAQEQELLRGQQEINKIEAASDNLFNSGWRPFIGWTCGAAFAWHFVGEPFFIFIAALFGKEIKISAALDLIEIMPMLFGMLGLGYYRTKERIAGVIPRGK
jgi:hypothetical protein